MYKGGKISAKEDRMWFMLNNKTCISILKPVGEKETATIMNGIGQGGFAVALASSIDIGSAVYTITKAEFTSNMPKNCLKFQEDITEMNRTMEDARKGAWDIGKMLDSKQLRANVGKSKFVNMAWKSRKS